MSRLKNSKGIDLCRVLYDAAEKEKEKENDDSFLEMTVLKSIPRWLGDRVTTPTQIQSSVYSKEVNYGEMTSCCGEIPIKRRASAQLRIQAKWKKNDEQE